MGLIYISNGVKLAINMRIGHNLVHGGAVQYII